LPQPVALKYNGVAGYAERIDNVLTSKEKALLFSPLVLYLGYVYYLAFHSARPFLLRWIDGSFGLFVALVFINILRRHLLEKYDTREESQPEGPAAPSDRGGDSSP